MDEVIFRSSQKLENLQVQMSLAASQSKDILQQYSQQGKSVILQAWNSSHSTQIKSHVQESWQYILLVGRQAQEKIWTYVDPQKLYYSLAQVLWNKWSRRDVCFMFAGFVCGSVVGIAFALSIRKKESVIRYMQAIQCTNYLGLESATVVETAIAPSHCLDDEVMITVKAASVHIIDAKICSGYGRRLRRFLQRTYRHSKQEFPITLGRDCVGIITDIGQNVKRLEIGDEVWLSVPFWFQGTLSQTIVVPEFRVGRKPKNIGFEGASSLPYAGCLAFDVLRNANITPENAMYKRILVLGGCTPVGCVLVQVLKEWKANITVSTHKKAVPVAKALGASEVIISPDPIQTDGKSSFVFQEDALNAYVKELKLKDKFHTIFLTRDIGISVKELKNVGSGKILSTIPEKRASDSCGFIGGFLLSSYIYAKYIVEKVIGICLNDFDEAHLCYVTLDEITDLVENGHIQTVVEKVYQPQDIEIALNHIQSPESIGSTIITFR